LVVLIRLGLALREPLGGIPPQAEHARASRNCRRERRGHSRFDVSERFRSPCLVADAIASTSATPLAIGSQEGEGVMEPADGHGKRTGDPSAGSVPAVDCAARWRRSARLRPATPPSPDLPADKLARADVEDSGEIAPATTRMEVRDVTGPN